MQHRKVLIAIPCKSGSVRIETFASILSEALNLQRHGITVMIRGQVGDSFIQRVRNCLIGLFVESDATDFVFIDDDIGIPPGSLKRLMEHPVDIVGATYRAKSDDHIGYPMRELDWKNPDRKRLEPDPDTGLIEVDALGCGFLRFSRSAIETMIESRKDDWFKMKNGMKVWDLCNVKRLPDHGDYEGEDYDLCKTARAAGLKVWLDPHLRMLHVGEKVFEGCVWDDLQRSTLQGTAPASRDGVRQRIEQALRAVV